MFVIVLAFEDETMEEEHISIMLMLMTLTDRLTMS
jgi:hypothetical protein